MDRKIYIEITNINEQRVDSTKELFSSYEEARSFLHAMEDSDQKERDDSYKSSELVGGGFAKLED